ncbi:MAG: glyoxalase superfamily protein [Streptosporangiaceae bacterium]
MDMKLELVPVPVSDVDRAKAFYSEKVGFRLDTDQQLNEAIRFVQLTPPGSACSIALGEGITQQQPGSLDGLLLVVKDIRATHAELTRRGVQVSEPAMQPWGATHADFSDPDGNRWTLQQPAVRDAQGGPEPLPGL